MNPKTRMIHAMKTQMLGRAPKFPALVVDDDPITRKLAQRALESRGFTVLTAENGEEGLKHIKEHGNTGIVALVDLNMPVMNGIEMLNAARGLRVRAAIATASSEPAEMARCFRTGAFDYFAKPINDWDALANILRKADADLQAERKESAHLETLKKQAEWQHWKGVFLSGAGAADERGNNVLDALHIQLNQDANYTQIVDLMEECPIEGDKVTIGKDLHEIALAMLKPIAKMANGIGIAKEIMGATPKLISMDMATFLEWLKKLIDERLKPIAERRNHELSIAVEDVLRGQGFVHIDEVSMASALEELVTNACKYSNPGDNVNFVVQCDDDRIAILVTNPARENARTPDGNPLAGVPKFLEELAFTFFVRFSIDTQLGYPELWPMGLGLPLARQVFLLCEGQLDIQNEEWHLFGQSDGAPSTVVSCRGMLPLHAKPLEEQSEEVDLDGVDLF